MLAINFKYATVCSGIEAPTAAWHPLGWQPAWFSEIEPFPCAVLAHHYPAVPNLGDMNNIEVGKHGPIDLFAGGTPCQSFSVAGLREGLADPRGNLALVFLKILAASCARWMVWENVPGVLSSNGGRDFGAFVGALGKLGYGWAYRILDAQHFGVPQRRRRVFVVGYLGNWRPAAAVLFERESLRGDSPPGRKTWEGVALPLGTRVDRGGSHREAEGNNLIAPPLTGNPYGDHESREGLLVSKALNGHGGSGRMDGESETFITHTLSADGFDASEDGTGRGTPLIVGSLCNNGKAAGSATQQDAESGLLVPISNSLNGNSGRQQIESTYMPVAFQSKASAHQSMNPSGTAPGLDVGKSDGIAVAFAQNQAVRRLTPRECARLQGFPDDYLDITYRGKPVADGNKYKALGNSMAVPVVRWIGERIQTVEAIMRLEQ